jgi:transketolase
MGQIKMALEMADQEKSKPTVIIADTIMGKGVKSIEDNNQWHGKAPSKEQVKEFLNELYE